MKTIPAYHVFNGAPKIPGVNNVIVVASGKGGVGKSTLSLNLALSLQDAGFSVGLLDADIYGPNLPDMLGVHERPKNDGKRIFPVMAHGLQTISMGYLVDPDKAMIWRGPMISGALIQLVEQTAWDNLDFLILDLPPGTGDVQLTLAQKVPVTGSIVVTTPEKVALSDAQKACAMFDKVNIPVLGLVENMSYFVCDGCDKRHAIFAQGGAKALADRLSKPLFAEIPILPSISDAGEKGAPFVTQYPDHAVTRLYRDIAKQCCDALSHFKPAHRVNEER
jgi:ATP-binding protein involved in chromosome partitioning